MRGVGGAGGVLAYACVQMRGCSCGRVLPKRWRSFRWLRSVFLFFCSLFSPDAVSRKYILPRFDCRWRWSSEGCSQISTKKHPIHLEGVWIIRTVSPSLSLSLTQHIQMIPMTMRLHFATRSISSLLAQHHRHRILFFLLNGREWEPTFLLHGEVWLTQCTDVSMSQQMWLAVSCLLVC